MIKLTAAALVAAALVGTAIAATPGTPGVPDPSKVEKGAYGVEPSHTRVRFSVNHFGFTTYSGDFNTSAGKLELDPADAGMHFRVGEGAEFSPTISTWGATWHPTIGGHPQYEVATSYWACPIRGSHLVLAEAAGHSRLAVCHLVDGPLLSSFLLSTVDLARSLCGCDLTID